ncbi:hypothetical protein ACH42_09015 [Endozoicomonas sp. (ex Bugula neritina AB1)]|nr:hypothetical protein ACH42_09015 [Endozoicomonas sp. (ex Bugula neritina AB1)]
MENPFIKGKAVARIIDFGSSKTKDSSLRYTEKVGTSGSLAPEIISKEVDDRTVETEVYAFAILCLKVTDVFYTERYDIFSLTEEELNSLMKISNVYTFFTRLTIAFPEYVADYLKAYEKHEYPDNGLMSDDNRNSRFILQCAIKMIHKNPDRRSSLTEVIFGKEKFPPALAPVAPSDLSTINSGGQ